MARRTTPLRLTSILAIRGEWSGNLRSTPSLATIAADGEHLAGAGAAAGDHDAGEDLDAFFVAFQDLRVHVDRVADAELGNFGLEARLLDHFENLLAHD